MGKWVLVLLLAAAGVWQFFLTEPATRPLWMPNTHQPLPPVGQGGVGTHRAYSLALRPDSTLHGWGHVYSGRLPVPDAVGRKVAAVPVVVETGTLSWQQVSAGANVSYAVTKSGELLRRPVNACCEEEAEEVKYRALFPDIKWLKVRESLGLTTGLAADGRVFAWREEHLDQGRAKYRDGGTCVQVLPDPPAETSAYGDFGRPGADNVTTYAYGDAAPAEAGVPAAAPKPPEVPVQVASDWVDFCGASQQAFNAAYPWGSREHWAYGVDRAGALWRLDYDVTDALQAPKAKLAPLPAEEKFQRVYCTDEADSDHMDEDAQVLAMDAQRRLWLLKGSRLAPVSKLRWSTVAPGRRYALGIDSTGKLWWWGWGYNDVTVGGMGDAFAAEKASPVETDLRWTEVDVAGKHIVARSRDGEVHTWGTNESGALADGNVAERRVLPKPVAWPPPP